MNPSFTVRLKPQMRFQPAGYAVIIANKTDQEITIIFNHVIGELSLESGQVWNGFERSAKVGFDQPNMKIIEIIKTPKSDYNLK